MKSRVYVVGILFLVLMLQACFLFDPSITDISISPTFIDIEVAETLQLTAQANYSDGSFIDVTYTATWSSNDSTVIEVDATGLITGIAGGTTTISVSYGGGWGNASATVTTFCGTISIASPDPSDGATVVVGGSGQYISVDAPGAVGGTFYYDDDDVIDWSMAGSVNGNVLEVTIPYASGKMNDNGINYWYVQAEDGCGNLTRYPATGSYDFTVGPGVAPSVTFPAPVDGITIAPGSAGQLFRVNAPLASSVMFYYDDDSVVTWSTAGNANGSFFDLVISYIDITNNGINYWYVEATNATGMTRFPPSGNLTFTVAPFNPATDPPSVFGEIPPDTITNWGTSSGSQLLMVTAIGATSGTFYYDDDDLSIDYSVPATVSGDSLEIWIPYAVGEMTDNGTNYWYVEAFNSTSGLTTRYPAAGNFSFTTN